MSFAPGWLRAVSRVNPLAYAVEDERALFRGDHVSWTVAGGSLVLAVTLLVAVLLGVRAYRRRAA
ncbi:hypothetical protein GCM10012275_51350 [Longimycelium tulufanense]|uniref:ABC transmembrane type-2 domain-containing protein n=1 Tax=Longimycelium tulufanense TaxID=907463 RepID=A0A8J3CCK9_9PSEU|nr:ABC transporter permease [Longimycelium tulufanense]GGM74394.1 hypothetical protein GCM10012275_51350 [Longimycelium tulufanense]